MGDHRYRTTQIDVSTTRSDGAAAIGSPSRQRCLEEIHSCSALRQTVLAAPPTSPRRLCSMMCGHDDLRWSTSHGLKPGNTAWRRGHGSQPARRRDICLARLLHAIERRCDEREAKLLQESIVNNIPSVNNIWGGAMPPLTPRTYVLLLLKPLVTDLFDPVNMYLASGRTHSLTLYFTEFTHFTASRRRWYMAALST